MITDKKISFKNAFKFSFNTIIDNFYLFFQVTFLYAILFFALSFMFVGIFKFYYSLDISDFVHLKNLLFQDSTFRIVLGLFVLAHILVYEHFVANLIKSALKFHNHEKVTYKNFFSVTFLTFLKFVGARLFYLLKTLIGLILFIVPGVYMYGTYYFTGFFIIDNNTGIGNDIYRNRIITKNVFYPISLLALFFIFFVYSFRNILMVLPIFALVDTHLYKQLSGQSTDE